MIVHGPLTCRVENQKVQIQTLRQVSYLVGIEKRYIDGNYKDSAQKKDQERRSKRLIAAFMLKQLIREEPLEKVAADFQQVRKRQELLSVSGNP